MLSKFNTVAMFFALWLGFMSLLVSASPIPIVLPPSAGIELFEDVVAREPVAIDVAKRDDVLTQELVEEVDKREPNPDPEIEVDIDVEARICRYGCL